MSSLVWMMLAAGLRLDGVTVVDPQAPADELAPRVRVGAGLRLGDAVGEGDVTQVLDQARRWALDARLDNHGNRYMGRVRGSVAGHANGLLLLGDRLTASAGGNNRKDWEGAAAYQLPLGRRGSSVALTAAHHHYQLGAEFAPPRAQGQVDAVGLMSTVPLTTRGPGGLTWQLGLEARHIRNEHRSVAIDDRRGVIAMTTGLQAVAYPSAGMAAWGGVRAEIGDLRLRDPVASRMDRQSARTAGQYLVLSADAALLRQWTSWGLLLRGSGQMADRNLDGSRQFVLGGARSVRAWPLEETSGDHGALLQAELRHRWQSLEPFGFVDAGWVRFRHTRCDTATRCQALPTGRMLAGAGVGLRWQHGPWRAEGTAGWRLAKEPLRRRSFTDPRAGTPQVWVSVGYSL